MENMINIEEKKWNMSPLNVDMKTERTIPADTVDCINDGHVIFIIISTCLWRETLFKLHDNCIINKIHDTIYGQKKVGT